MPPKSKNAEKGRNKQQRNDSNSQNHHVTTPTVIPEVTGIPKAIPTFTIQVADRFSYEPITQLIVSGDATLPALMSQLTEYFRREERRPEYRFIFVDMRLYRADPSDDSEPPAEITGITGPLSAAGVQDGSRLLVDGARTFEEMIMAMMHENKELRSEGQAAMRKQDAAMKAQDVVLGDLKAQNASLQQSLKDVEKRLQQRLRAVEANTATITPQLATMKVDISTVKAGTASVNASLVAANERMEATSRQVGVIEQAVTFDPRRMAASKPACKKHHDNITVTNATVDNRQTVVTEVDGPKEVSFHLPNAVVRPGDICVVEFSFSYKSGNSIRNVKHFGFTPVSNPWLSDENSHRGGYFNSGYSFNLGLNEEKDGGHKLYASNDSEGKTVNLCDAPLPASAPRTHTAEGTRIYALVVDMRRDAACDGQLRVYWSDDDGSAASITCRNTKRVPVTPDAYIPWGKLFSTNDSFIIRNIYMGRGVPPAYLSKMQ